MHAKINLNTDFQKFLIVFNIQICSVLVILIRASNLFNFKLQETQFRTLVSSLNFLGHLTWGSNLLKKPNLLRCMYPQFFFLSWYMEMVKNIFRNTKKVIPEFCDFFGPYFWWHKTEKSWFLMIFEAGFRQSGTLFRKCFFFWNLQVS